MNSFERKATRSTTKTYPNDQKGSMPIFWLVQNCFFTEANRWFQESCDKTAHRAAILESDFQNPKCSLGQFQVKLNVYRLCSEDAKSTNGSIHLFPIKVSIVPVDRMQWLVVSDYISECSKCRSTLAKERRSAFKRDAKARHIDAESWQRRALFKPIELIRVS